jgi:hypothetical protein
LVIDIGHVHHHFVESAGEVLEQIVTNLHEKIVAYHMSSVVGDHGWHYPMVGSPVQALLARVPLNGATRVLESPIQRRKNGIAEVMGELTIATANIRV